MCGIIGKISIKKEIIACPPIHKINHRGPDGQGEWTTADGKIYFGHTRLAIIEPTAAGMQPMKSHNGLFTIIFNGEIYNHLDIRATLPAIKWRSNSDTETLLELLALKGLNALHLVKGMFAFALHNSDDNSVLLVRDRLGIKPLWFKQTEADFVFCSEIRPLMRPGKADFNENAFSEYVAFGRMPSTGEVIDGIASIAPGHWMKIFPSGTIEKGAFWPPSFKASEIKDKEGSVQRVKKLVTTAIEEHLISDVGVGAFLSGGIDSSIVTLVAGKSLGQRLRTFTIGFPQSALDERKIARLVAKKAGSEHNELEINENDCLTWVEEAVRCMDLPSVDAINTYIVSKAVVDEGLKVALSGLGGDELFGGYPSFRDVPLLFSLFGKLPSRINQFLVDLMPKKHKEKLGGLERFTAENLAVARRRFISVPTLKSMGLSAGSPSLPPTPDGLDLMGVISWAEIHGYMIPMLLRDSDQMSMAVSLEVRVPFLDHQLVEEVLSLNQIFKRGKETKSLLIEAFRNELPQEVYNRPKQGFVLPMQDWVLGPLSSFTKEGLQAAADILGHKKPLELMQDLSQGVGHWTRIWKWSVLGHWLLRKNTEVSGVDPLISSSTLDYIEK